MLLDPPSLENVRWTVSSALGGPKVSSTHIWTEVPCLLPNMLHDKLSVFFNWDASRNPVPYSTLIGFAWPFNVPRASLQRTGRESPMKLCWCTELNFRRKQVTYRRTQVHIDINMGGRVTFDVVFICAPSIILSRDTSSFFLPSFK